jgi:ketosteroid isomerase-like protein
MENEIKQVIEKRVSAIKDRNVQNEISNYFKNVISYDVVGNLKYEGVDAIKNRLSEWLSTLDKIIDFEVTDIKLNSTSKIANCSRLNHINAKTVDGNKLDMYSRES